MEGAEGVGSGVCRQDGAAAIGMRPCGAGEGLVGTERTVAVQPSVEGPRRPDIGEERIVVGGSRVFEDAGDGEREGGLAGEVMQGLEV